MQTSTGKHVMLWQADESNWNLSNTGPHGHELRFVTNTFSWITTQRSNLGTNMHYVFVPEASSAAVATWGAKALAYHNASTLASRVDNGNKMTWTQVKRLPYELQDLADIHPTPWQSGAWYTHWLSTLHADVLLESPGSPT